MTTDNKPEAQTPCRYCGVAPRPGVEHTTWACGRLAGLRAARNWVACNDGIGSARDAAEAIEALCAGMPPAPTQAVAPGDKAAEPARGLLKAHVHNGGAIEAGGKAWAPSQRAERSSVDVGDDLAKELGKIERRLMVLEEMFTFHNGRLTRRVADVAYRVAKVEEWAHAHVLGADITPMVPPCKHGSDSRACAECSAPATTQRDSGGEEAEGW